MIESAVTESAVTESAVIESAVIESIHTTNAFRGGLRNAGRLSLADCALKQGRSGNPAGRRPGAAIQAVIRTAAR